MDQYRIESIVDEWDCAEYYSVDHFIEWCAENHNTQIEQYPSIQLKFPEYLGTG